MSGVDENDLAGEPTPPVEDSVAITPELALKSTRAQGAAALEVKVPLNDNTYRKLLLVLAGIPGLLNEEQCDTLIQHFFNDISFLEELAGNPAVSEYLRDKLLAHPDLGVHCSALRTHLHSLPSDRLCALVRPETLRILASSTHSAVLIKVTDHILEIPRVQAFQRQACAILDNPQLPIEYINQLRKNAERRKTTEMGEAVYYSNEVIRRIDQVLAARSRRRLVNGYHF